MQVDAIPSLATAGNHPATARFPAWHEAFLALGTPDGADVRGMPEAEAVAARKHGNHERADRHHYWAAYQAMSRRYREQEETFAATMDDRREWEHATEHSRHLAVTAEPNCAGATPASKSSPSDPSGSGDKQAKAKLCRVEIDEVAVAFGPPA
jgi:hypothetical protein